MDWENTRNVKQRSRRTKEQTNRDEQHNNWNEKYTRRINNRITEAEEWIIELEDKIVEITAEEQNKEKRMNRIEDNLRDLWDNTKHTNIQIIGVPEEEKNKGSEKIFEEITVKNFPNMEKEIVTQVQEA